jgi:hypothetical protein
MRTLQWFGREFRLAMHPRQWIVFAIQWIAVVLASGAVAKVKGAPWLVVGLVVLVAAIVAPPAIRRVADTISRKTESADSKAEIDAAVLARYADVGEYFRVPRKITPLMEATFGTTVDEWKDWGTEFFRTNYPEWTGPFGDVKTYDMGEGAKVIVGIRHLHPGDDARRDRRSEIAELVDHVREVRKALLGEPAQIDAWKQHRIARLIREGEELSSRYTDAFGMKPVIDGEPRNPDEMQVMIFNWVARCDDFVQSNLLKWHDHFHARPIENLSDHTYIRAYISDRIEELRWIRDRL